MPKRKRAPAASDELFDATLNDVQRSVSVGADDPMTEAQAAYLRELVDDEPGEEFDPSLSRHAASQRIAELLVKHMEHSPSAASHR